MPTRLVDPAHSDEEFLTAAFRGRWTPLKTVYPTATEPYQLVYGSGDSSIRFVADDHLRVAWVVADGPSAAALLASMDSTFSSWPPEEAFRRWKDGETLLDKETALAWCGALATEGPDPRVSVVLEEALAHVDRDLRLFATIVMLFAPWPETIALAERVRRDDVDEAVRTNAETVYARLMRS